MTQYYVAPNGSDAAAGTYLAPFLTLRHATDVATGSGRRTIWVRGGTYPERIDTQISTIVGGADWRTKLMIAAWRNETVVIQPTASRCLFFGTIGTSYTELRGLTFDASLCTLDAVKLTYSGGDPATAVHHVRLRKCIVKNAPDQGVLITTSHHNEIIGCTIRDNGSVATTEHGVYIASSYNVVRDCTITRNAAYGLHVYNGAGSGADGNRLINNDCSRNTRIAGASFGILVGSGVGNVARFNRCDEAYGGIQVGGDSVNAVIQHNRAKGNTSTNYYIDGAAVGTVFEDNE